jgi:chromosomal replication initiator protein
MFLKSSPSDLPALGKTIIGRFETIEPQLVRNWFRALRADSIDAGSLVFLAENDAQVRFLENQCLHAWTIAAQQVTGKLLTVSFKVDPDLQNNSQMTSIPARWSGASLDKTYTFENFATGPCNRLAEAAARSVASQGELVYNPVCIHGPMGSGKTHLLQSIAHQCASQNRLVCYLNGEQLIDRLIIAIEKGEEALLSSEALRLDLLLIDNFHALAGRERSQEAFFPLFNQLVASGKQIVVATAAPPPELSGLHQRLATRLSAGLVVQLDPPCKETRIAILRRHADFQGILLSDHLIRRIAERIVNPRDLCRTLQRIDLTARFQASPITAELVDEVLA